VGVGHLLKSEPVSGGRGTGWYMIKSGVLHANVVILCVNHSVGQREETRIDLFPREDRVLLRT